MDVACGSSTTAEATIPTDSIAALSSPSKRGRRLCDHHLPLERVGQPTLAGLEQSATKGRSPAFRFFLVGLLPSDLDLDPSFNAPQITGTVVVTSAKKNEVAQGEPPQRRRWISAHVALVVRNSEGQSLSASSYCSSGDWMREPRWDSFGFRLRPAGDLNRSPAAGRTRESHRQP